MKIKIYNLHRTYIKGYFSDLCIIYIIPLSKDKIVETSIINDSSIIGKLYLQSLILKFGKVF